MIGDKWIDLECGWNAGLKKSFLVRTGYGRGVEKKLGIAGGEMEIVDDIPAAANAILKQEGRN